MMISAFGLAVQLGLPVPELEPLGQLDRGLLPPGPPLRVELAPAEELDLAWSGPRSPSQIARAVIAGSGWTAERGVDWDLRMEHALGRFHLDPAATLLRCTPRDRDDPAWRQLLLDTALVTASLVRGFDALHAGAVVTGGGAVAIAGVSGAGKTTVMLELLRRGARFLSDDVVALRAGEEGVLALPGPPVANLPATEPVGELADRLHRFDGEWWVRIRDAHRAPVPVRAVLVLDRAPVPARRLAETAAPLLQHALHGGATAERRGARFELLARLSDQVEVIGLGVDRSRPAGELVERLTKAFPLLQASG